MILQGTKLTCSVFPTTMLMLLGMSSYPMVRLLIMEFRDNVGANISGMIQDRIEKLGRDVFYDMLSNGREPLHALCVLKVRTG